MNDYHNILAKHEDNGGLSLVAHLKSVARVAELIAAKNGMDVGISRKGAILHDIGKASPLFQQTLRHGYMRMPGFIFRHEIASLFFISLLDDSEKDIVIDSETGALSTLNWGEFAKFEGDVAEENRVLTEHMTTYDISKRENLAAEHDDRVYVADDVYYCI